MTIKEFIPAIGAGLKTGLKKVGAAIMGADMLVLAKAGIIIGTAVITGVALYKFIRDRRRVYKEQFSDDCSSPTDDGLNENYSDARKQENLHPAMKNVSNELRNHRVYGKKKKKGKDIIWELSQRAKERRVKHLEDEANYRLFEFETNMDHYFDTEPKFTNSSCRLVWEFTDGCWDDAKWDRDDAEYGNIF